MLHTKFRVNSIEVLEMIFEGFLPYGHSCHTGHVTMTILLNFHSMAQKRLIRNMASISPLVLEMLDENVDG